LRRSHWWLLVGLRITKSQPISGHQRAWLPSSRLLWAFWRRDRRRNLLGFHGYQSTKSAVSED
jgi:hypothetical protein